MAEKPDRTITKVIDELDNLIAEIPRLNDTTVDKIDTRIRSAIGKASQGLSPIQLVLAYTDWLAHLSISPARRVKLLQSFSEKLLQLTTYTARTIAEKTEEPPQGSSLFKHQLWRKLPFSIMARSHSLATDWLREADAGVAGMDPLSIELVNFMNQQLVEIASPSNFLPTNPEALKVTWDNKGKNLLEGIGNFQRDVQKKLLKDNRPEMGDFKVGENLGVTPGQVIFQNHLIELIQYSPSTETVASEPLLIVPAWIMKYYILDLQPENSMVKYLVDQGKTVFMISWKNPVKEDRDLDLDDYLKSGFLAALDAVKAVVPDTKINTMGYCIGGTLLSIGASYLAREGDDSLNSITLLAAQMDFTEAGEITRFLGASQLAFLDSMMWTDGYLEAANMSGAFKALRSQDMIWNPAVERYYLGRETKPIALMAWNADGTRMPAAMHSRYLHELFVENRLAQCKFLVDGKPIAVQDIRAPLFVVGTSADHVAPWKSVYKIHNYARSDITFLLTSGGHNAGIACGPEHPRRSYQVAFHEAMDRYIDPDTWTATQETHTGSWWPVFNLWLDQQCSEAVQPPTMGAADKGYAALWPAPGKYVFG
ncbi:MAG: alpha/beta fold hydrolase [Porticoccaceae bacterium]